MHEPLNRAFAGAVSKIHTLCDLTLQVKCQAIFCAIGQFMHVASHRQQETLCPAEAAIFCTGQQAHTHQFRRCISAVHIFADPIERLQIAQAAFAFFDIGFHHIAAVAHAFMALIAFFQFQLEKITLTAAHNIAPEPHAGFLVNFLIAPHHARFEQGSADGQILFRHADCVADRAAGMANFQAQIPQQVKHGLNHLLTPWRAAHGGDEGDIDIRMRRHFRTPISTHSQQRQTLRSGAIGGGI